jgi:hypothetical protein
MRKIAINNCYGGFNLSHEACVRARELGLPGIVLESEPYEDGSGFASRSDWMDDWSYMDRDHPALIQTIEELGLKANGDCAYLKIVEIPDDVEWTIESYDGNEWVAEVHRTWS